MLKFDKDWPQEVADISTLPEFQNAEVRIATPAVYDYDVITGENVVVTPEVLLYEGQARIIGVRWGIFYSGQTQANSRSEKSIRFQIPYQSADRVNTGAIVKVTSSPRNPVLLDYVFTITNDFQGSNSAARTFEASMDGDSQVANG